jgi:Domain of unknown function (DUF4123)
VPGVFGKACSTEVCLHQQGGLKVQSFIEASAHNPQWHWYAVADAAQHRDLPGALVRNSGLQTRCLFDAPVDSALAAQSPHLVELEQPSDQAPSWKWIKRYANGKPCVTVIASNVGFDALFAHLQRFTEVFLPDGKDMFFAFWDPAILGVLVGQNDDPTLYVRGPVLNDKQYATLTHPMAGWWYWDRDGNLRSIKIITGTTEHADTPLQLTQKQVDDLVEASVPDHVRSHIELNQPQLLRDIELAQRYGLMRKHLLNARQLKLEAMGDLVNYVCAALIYQDQFQTNPEITALLEKVKGGELPLVKALEQMP